jgi:hypothetical protein
MAQQPQFAGTVLMGAISVSASADTSYTAPTNAVTVVSAGTSGSKIDEIDFQGTGTTIAGTITVFLFDGSIYHLYDNVPVPAVTASTTVIAWRLSKTYANLVLLSGWSLRCATTVASQLVKVSAFGGSF